jgi:hypothetical protein
MHSIDLTGWKEDEEFSPYPEGSRDKYALIAPEAPDEACIFPNHRYLMKFSNPRYPVQFWSEIIAGVVGYHVGVDVPPCHYAEDTKTRAPGSLIEWFYGDPIERNVPVSPVPLADVAVEDLDIPVDVPSTHSLYVPGSSYMARQIEGYDLKTGRQHNLKHIGFLIARFRQRWGLDFWPYWAKILTFDTIIGNTDRHQDNWGVLWRADESGTMAPRFAPAFDNGTSLLHEITEQNLAKFDDPEIVTRYVMRGRHHVRWELDNEKPMGHIALIAALLQRRPTVREAVVSMIEAKQDNIYRDIEKLGEFVGPVPLGPKRIETICKVISRRFEILKEIPKND